mmetsp:Transcript_20380/g.49327  ORF Transcript_20380/g.49327 Transcript_20380/m.49327 type:complete len:297 (+) Transcript_20380:781-1671(+)
MSAAKPPLLDPNDLTFGLAASADTGEDGGVPLALPPLILAVSLPLGFWLVLALTGATWDHPSSSTAAGLASLASFLGFRSFFFLGVSALSSFFFSVYLFSFSTSFWISSSILGPATSLRAFHPLLRSSPRSMIINLYLELSLPPSLSSCSCAKYPSRASLSCSSNDLPTPSSSLHRGWILSWSPPTSASSLVTLILTSSSPTMFNLNSSPMNSTLPRVRCRSLRSFPSFSSSGSSSRPCLSGSLPTASNSERHLPTSTSPKGSTPSSSSNSGRSSASLWHMRAYMLMKVGSSTALS